MRPGRTARSVASPAAVVVCVVALGGASVSAAVQPPPGTPDLSQMALRSTDLPPGTTVAHQGYRRDRDYVATYVRDFGPLHIGRARLALLESEVQLDKTADEAAQTFAGLKVVMARKSFRRLLAREVIKAAKGEKSLKASKVTIAKPRNLRVGDGALVLLMTVRAARVRIDAALAFGIRDRVETTLMAVGMPGTRLHAADLKPLVAATADHVQVGLSPISTTPPTIAGTPQQGQSLTAAPGTWANAPTSYAYQWQRCDAAGAACTAIPGATAQSYAVGPADAGASLRVTVTASNPVGQSPAGSAQTPVVT